MVADQAEDVRESAERHYGLGQRIWDPGDRWNSRKVQEIEHFCSRLVPGLVTKQSRVLNAGAGSHEYRWMPPQAISVDTFPAQLKGRDNAVVADIEALPFSDGSFDLVVCVGSVLNYVSALEALSEVCRVLDESGWLILHFETSDSFEHVFTGRWRATAAPLATVNNGKRDIIWVYSQAFIRRALANLGMSVGKVHAFHIGSAGLLRLGLPQQIAAYAQPLDRFMWPLRALADDLILVAQKSGPPIV